MYDLEHNLQKDKVERCLKADPILQKSLGLKQRYKSLKQAGVILGIWMLILFATPLPEWMMLNRIGVFATLVILLICWQVDLISHKLETAEAAENLYGILKNDPKITLEPLDDDQILLRHAKFQARCSTMSQLQLKAMLDVEEAVQNTIKSALETPAPTVAATTSPAELRKQAPKRRRA